MMPIYYERAEKLAAHVGHTEFSKLLIAIED